MRRAEGITVEEVHAVAAKMYDLLAGLTKQEEWYLGSKLHGLIADFVLWGNLALANVGPTGHEFDWAQFRKYAVALQMTYKFAGQQGIIELDPEFMVHLKKLQSQIDIVHKAATSESKSYRKVENERDLQPWLEKYQIWQKLNGESHE